MFSGCKRQHNKELDAVYRMAFTSPDQALVMLDSIDGDKLQDCDKAKYSLLYYMAQDKSGLDVDNDSLIRIARDWYDKHPEDSLYALCLYYSGKCLLLQDSLAQAKVCMEKAYSISDSIGDHYTRYLALDKIIAIEEHFAPLDALELTRKLVEITNNNQNISTANRVRSLLRLCINYLCVDSLQQSLTSGKQALELAEQTSDVDLQSDVYQDLAIVFEKMEERDSALVYARKAYAHNHSRISGQLSLASAYIESDSVEQAQSILKEVCPRNIEEQFTLFYYLNLLAIKMHDYKQAKVLSDSAFTCLEGAYFDAMNDKVRSYAAIQEKEEQKAKLEGRNEMQMWVCCLGGLALMLIIVLIMYVHISTKRQAAANLAFEQQKQNLIEEQHRKEMASKEHKLSVMRNCLLMKIEVAEKIESVLKGQTQDIVLSEKDWKDIEVLLDSADDSFITRLKEKHPDLTQKDLHLMMLLRMRLPQKALASVYKISEKAIKQKLFLYKEKVGIMNEKQSLRNYIENF